MMEWINAEYELPDKDGYYLVFIPGEFHNSIMVARFAFNRELPWRGAQAHSAIEGVTHWMMLPEEPKEGR